MTRLRSPERCLFSVRVGLTYAPRRPDFEDVACGFTFGADGGAGLASLAGGAFGTFDCGL